MRRKISRKRDYFDRSIEQHYNVHRTKPLVTRSWSSCCCMP